MTHTPFVFEVQLGPTGSRSAWPDARQARGVRVWLRWAVVVLLALAPVPLALNRPPYWLGFAAIVFALLTLERVLGRSHLFRVRGQGALIIVACLLPLAAVAQVLAVRFDLWSIPPLPAASGLAALRLASYIALFCLVVQLTRRTASARQMAWALFWVCVGHALWAMIALRLGAGPSPAAAGVYEGVAVGFFVNRNAFAAFISMGGVLGLALVLGRAAGARSLAFGPDRLLIAVPGVGLLVILVALVATQSRLGLGAGLLGGLVVCLCARRGRVSWHLIGFVLLAVASLGVLLRDMVLTRLVDLGPAIQTRMHLYAQTWSMIMEHPWTGWGMDNFRPAFEGGQRPPLDTSLLWELPHSTYLTYWVEMGVIVGSLPLLLGLITLCRLRRRVRQGVGDRDLAIAALGALTVGAVHSTADFVLEVPANTYLFVTLLALGLAQRGPRSPRSNR